MRTNTTLRNLLVIGIVSLIIYAIADGIRYGSTWGVAMGLCSMIALVVSVNFARKLAHLKEEEEEQ